MSAKTGVVLAVGVLACLSGVALAEERPSSVTVAATGTVHAKPDVARFVVVLQEQDDKVEKAVKDLEGSLEKFLTQLAALEGAPVEVKVSEPSVYVYRPGGGFVDGMTVRQPPVQHIASVLVSVSVDDPDVPKLQNVWSVFYQALEAGGGLYEEDTGYISTSRSRPYVVVDVKDQETYLTQAVQEAVKSARPLAEVAAASVGAKLGPVLWVSTTRRPYDIDTSLPRIYEKEPKEDLSRVPITAAVTVTYKLLLDERAEQ